MKVNYVINGYVTSDSNDIVINTYKFQCIGSDNKKYGWITIEHYHGIGTGTDNFGESEIVSGALKVINFLHTGDKSRVVFKQTDDFNEIIEARAKMIESLQKEL